MFYTKKINLKFIKGDKVYTIKKGNVPYKCDVCDGTGIIKYKDKDLCCPECKGEGNKIIRKDKWVVIDDTFTIVSTKISLDENFEQNSIRYKLRNENNTLRFTRTETNCFLSKEEAEKRCEFLNSKNINIKLDNITITDEFKNTPPSIEKIISKLNYYKENNKFDKEIYINSDNELVDGYITYLICKMLNIEEIIVRII